MSIEEVEELRVRWAQALALRGACPRCASVRVWHDGVRDRKASVFIVEQVDFVADVPARRLKCRDCGKRWILRPERITSRAHYQPCVVSHAIAAMEQTPDVSATEIARAHGCHRRTLGRWIDRVAEIAEPAALAASVLMEIGAPVLPEVPTEIQRATGSAHTRTQLLRALVVLVLLEALASLRGLEPPALAHTDVLVLAPPIPANALGPRIRGDPRSIG